MKGFEGQGRPTATDESFFKARAELTHYERCLLIILDYEGERDNQVDEYQECRVYQDELDCFNQKVQNENS